MQTDLRRWMTLCETITMIGEGMLSRASYWITDKGEMISAPRPDAVWHDEAAAKHFIGQRDPMSAAFSAGWIRSNAAGHYLDLQMNFDTVSPVAIREAIRMVKEVDDPDISFNIEGDIGQDTKTYSSPLGAIRFLNQCARSSRYGRV